MGATIDCFRKLEGISPVVEARFPPMEIDPEWRIFTEIQLVV